ncbi:hypothetical protein TSTA_116510 [Talaromyces stipitatus ATCC 10500]|uniref:Zn(2)-C6 fungal-type domain-containing protein n=1 Tax=Talaromyces stipitatus (strain ATCC 10500 / CBS 375.48 / QM 6759 / NRRL 1006) TaxID=441959 RepID=B8MBJ7_TALSN|nr:uncharacterized protein TSTA_116510 [Talaromyces stipitatus ATCC 10500]EED17861.1 hypothetical protein TSTA_116510 [Talaromyces stipitatus ATCC 10500]
MSITYSRIEHPGHTFPLQSMSYHYDGGRHGQDRNSRHYRLPPPHSSIPIGLIADEQQTSSHQRTDAQHSRNDFPAQRENLPSVHQLLSGGNAGYLPSLPPPTSRHGHSLQNSPSIHSLPPSSHYKPPRKSHGGYPDYSSLATSGDREYEDNRSPQSGTLPPISQVGMEASYTRPSHRSRSHLVSDEDSSRSQSKDATASPRHSDPSLSHFVSSPGQEGSRPGSRGPAVPNQVVDERYLPGKGVCYIFADNSYCPKLIDGQPVNPNWGLTKAGKARKRLAQACIPCREKKVKCQPNLPKCDQCQKSGRECRFESAPRGSRARSSSYDPQSA